MRTESRPTRQYAGQLRTGGAIADPKPWPGGPPEGARYTTDRYYGGHWSLWSTPPEPWPEEPPDGWDAHIYGPVGTVWTVEQGDWENAAGDASENVLRRLLSKMRLWETPQGMAYRDWVVPPAEHEPDPEQEYRMRYVRLAIVGKLGTVESITHTLGLRTAPVVDVDQDAAALQTLANQVRDIWTSWWNTPSVGGNRPATFFHSSLQYTEVRAAYVSVPGPGTRQVLPAPPPPPGARKLRDKIVYNYPTVEYLVRTQYANFAAGITGTDSIALPYEVAACLSLDSGRRGPANRGRFYLGGLGTSIMGSSSEFDPTKMQNFASSFAINVIKAINLGTGCDVHVVSRYWNDSIPVSAIRAGVVPDSQRRRRRSQPEKYGALVNTPLVGP